MSDATKQANIRMLDYVEHENYAISVDKFIKIDLVYYLNTNPKFVPYITIRIKNLIHLYPY